MINNIFKIIVVYFAFFLQFIDYLYIGTNIINLSLFGALSTIVMFYLLFDYISTPCNKYIKFMVLTYFLLLGLNMVFIQKLPFGSLARWGIPIILLVSVDNYTIQKCKPIFYFLLLFFVINTCIAYYERITCTYLFEVDIYDEMMQGQVNIGENAQSSFRSFALLGHPLWNANIIAFMSVIIYFSDFLTSKVRIPLAFLGYGSLYCFNARMAIIVSSMLAVYLFLKGYGKSRKKYFYIFWGIIVTFVVFMNFDKFGGRLLDEEIGIDDNSSMVRILTIEEFLSVPFNDLLVGGYNYSYGENGLLQILMTFGLIIGGYKLYTEFILCYNGICFKERYKKWSIFISFLGIAISNNNLVMPRFIFFYAISILFILRYSQIQQNKGIEYENIYN